MTDDTGPSVEEAFGLVADETRVGILRALWETADSDETVSFSTLRERVGVRDSGRFNYHLGKLVPEFVREAEDGYALTFAGYQVVGAALSGAYTDAVETTYGPIGVDDCRVEGCDGTTQLRYHEGAVVFACDTCDRTPDVVPSPPVLVEAHDVESDPNVVSQFGQTVIEKINRGFCHFCNGPVEASVARLDPRYEPALDGAVDVITECGECGWRRRAGAVSALIGHPAVVARLHDAGIDHRATPHWEQAWITDAEETIASEDPVRVAVETQVGDERVTFTLDEDLDLVDVE